MSDLIVPPAVAPLGSVFIHSKYYCNALPFALGGRVVVAGCGSMLPTGTVGVVVSVHKLAWPAPVTSQTDIAHKVCVLIIGLRGVHQKDNGMTWMFRDGQ